MASQSMWQMQGNSGIANANGGHVDIYVQSVPSIDQGQYTRSNNNGTML